MLPAGMPSAQVLPFPLPHYLTDINKSFSVFLFFSSFLVSSQLPFWVVYTLLASSADPTVKELDPDLI